MTESLSVLHAVQDPTAASAPLGSRGMSPDSAGATEQLSQGADLPSAMRYSEQIFSQRGWGGRIPH